MTYERHGKWICLVVIVIMIVILVNSQGCAKLILRYNDVVAAQEGDVYYDVNCDTERAK